MKVEYKWIDISPSWSLNTTTKMEELINRLNDLGQEGWILISGVEVSKYAVFMRIIEE